LRRIVVEAMGGGFPPLARRECGRIWQRSVRWRKVRISLVMRYGTLRYEENAV